MNKNFLFSFFAVLFFSNVTLLFAHEKEKVCSAALLDISEENAVFCVADDDFISVPVASSQTKKWPSHPMIVAAKERDLIGMQVLIDNCLSAIYNPRSLIDNPLDVQDEYGNTPLHYAILNQDVTMLNLLVENKASLNIRNNENKYPLNLAMQIKNMTMMEMVVAAVTEIRLQQDQLSETRQGYFKCMGMVSLMFGMLGAIIRQN